MCVFSVFLSVCRVCPYAFGHAAKRLPEGVLCKRYPPAGVHRELIVFVPAWFSILLCVFLSPGVGVCLCLYGGGGGSRFDRTKPGELTTRIKRDTLVVSQGIGIKVRVVQQYFMPCRRGACCCCCFGVMLLEKTNLAFHCLLARFLGGVLMLGLPVLI